MRLLDTRTSTMARTTAFRLAFLVVACVACVARTDDGATTSHVQAITEENAHLIEEGEWMLEFYAPWCPACKKFDPVWNEFGQWASDSGVRVGKVDVTVESGLSGRFLITALPTIYHVKNKIYRIYDGHRSLDDLMSYVEEQKWESVEPVAWWRAPSSPFMVLLGTTFKVSMALRDVHRVLTESYGIPNWGAYGIFALATIIIGVLIGTMIVCLADCFVGRKPTMAPPPPPTKKGPPNGADKESEENSASAVAKEGKEKSRQRRKGNNKKDN